MDVKNVLLVHKQDMCNIGNETTNIVKSVLEKNNINYNEVCRSKLTKDCVKNVSLIMVVGGDGTFLKAAQFVLDETPTMGVNSNIEETEGNFTCCDKGNFEKIFGKLLKGKFRNFKLHRLKAEVDGKFVGRALNEFYIGHKDVSGTSRYVLRVGKKEEEQKSSGVLIGAAAGSTAWIYSAGGKKLSLNSDKFQYVVRDAYSGRLTKAKMTRDVLKKDKKVEIDSKSDNLILIADSIGFRLNLKNGQKIVFSVDDKIINLIMKSFF